MAYVEYLKKNRHFIKDMVKKSSTWFLSQSILLGRHVNINQILRENSANNKVKIIPGEMYIFEYDAKHKDTLPYFDRYPLVFPFKALPDGFIGLNLHYLPIQLRAVLMDNLDQLKSDNRYNSTTRIKASWAMLQSISKHKLMEPCVHRYLYSQAQSPFKKIDSPDWGTALMLPVEKFVGASKQQVWKDSIR